MASDTRHRILSVAARLFEAQGFDGTAVSAILREADVNSGSLYHFFPSKEALLVSVLQGHLNSLDSLLADASRATDQPLDKVFALLELYRGRLLVSGFSRGCPVGHLALDAGARHAEARAIVDSYFNGWVAGVRSWLDQAAGKLPAAVDREALAVTVLSTMQGGVMQARAAGAIDPFDASVNQLRILFGLLARSAGASRPERSARVARSSPEAATADDRSPVIVGVGDAKPGAQPKREGEMVDEDDPAWWRAW
jgi:AcrR family transcriptional regulator